MVPGGGAPDWVTTPLAADRAWTAVRDDQTDQSSREAAQG
jgi:hypothetical protein